MTDTAARLAAIREECARTDWHFTRSDVLFLLAEVESVADERDAARRSIVQIGGEIVRDQVRRDRYRLAWLSARRRASAYEVTDGLRHAVRVALEQHRRADVVTADLAADRDEAEQLRARLAAVWPCECGHLRDQHAHDSVISRTFCRGCPIDTDLHEYKPKETEA